MNRRIFPLNINGTKMWTSWNNYLLWLDSEINSINDYLKYWNPDYKICGETLYYIDSETGLSFSKNHDINNIETITLYNSFDISETLINNNFTHKAGNDWIPSEEWDKNLTIIIEEAGLYEFRFENSSFTVNDKEYEKKYTIQLDGESEISFSFLQYPSPMSISVWKGGETINCCNMGDLFWREGVSTSHTENLYLKLKNFTIYDNTIENLLEKKYILLAKPYTIYFPKSWTHQGVQSSSNILLQDPSFYFNISIPFASLYTPTTIENNLIFNWIENGQRIVGTNIFCSLEFSPSRYFLTQEKNAYWGRGGVVWNEEGAYWKNQDSEQPIIHISTASGGVWANNYPLMHECYVREQNTNSFEEFIFDNDFSTEITNIANHSTVLYNINAKNITSNETEFWNDFVYVKII